MLEDNRNKKIKVGIIDLRTSNLFSIFHAIKKAGFNVNIVDTKKSRYDYDILILPGVGSYKFAMKFIKNYGLDEKIFEHTLNKKKFLVGICLGMQLLFEESSEFGYSKGLGLIKGRVKKIDYTKNYPVPHMGWNHIILNKHKNNFFTKQDKKNMFYFVHSYYCIPENSKNICTDTIYGNLKFCSSVRESNIFGMQFHPEKSSKPGISILSKLKKLI
tara:strand:+ start:54 stop:701 length:648 start_codon:yes stop_codon:yes gene_type:complete